MAIVFASSPRFSGDMVDDTISGLDAFQHLREMDLSTHMTPSNYEQISMLGNNNIFRGSYRNDTGSKIGSTPRIENNFDENVNSDVSQMGWSNLEPISSQNALGMNLFDTAPQVFPTHNAHEIASGVRSRGEMIRRKCASVNPQSWDLQSLVAPKRKNPSDGLRSCTGSDLKTKKRRRTASGFLNTGLVNSEINRNDAKVGKDGRLNRRALAHLKTEFLYNPRPSHRTIRNLARLIRGTVDDISQWFDLKRAQRIPIHPNSSGLTPRSTEASIFDAGISSLLARQCFPGPDQTAWAKTSCKIGNRTSNSRKKKWQCTNSDCLKLLKNRSEWIRHENTHGQPKKYVCMCNDCSRGVAVPCQTCTLASQRSKVFKANCQCTTCGRHRFHRKDKLQEHLRKKHNLELPSSMISTWIDRTDSDTSSRCGFCGEKLINWDVRLLHIAEHFERGWEMSSWNLKFTEATDVSDDEDEDEEEDVNYVSDSDETEGGDSDDDTHDEKGGTFGDAAPESDGLDENQDRNFEDRGTGNDNDNYDNWNWQNYSHSGHNSSYSTALSIHQRYATVASICRGNFRYYVFTQRRLQCSSPRFPAASDDRMRQLLVVTFHKNQIKAGPSNSKTCLAGDFLAQVGHSYPRSEYFQHCVSFLSSIFSTVHPKYLTQIQKAQITTTTGRIDSFETFWHSERFIISNTALGNLLVHHHILGYIYQFLDPGPPISKHLIPEVSVDPNPAVTQRSASCHTMISDVSHFPVTGSSPASSVSHEIIPQEISSRIEFSLPYKQNSTFIGREDTLRFMEQSLLPSQNDNGFQQNISPRSGTCVIGCYKVFKDLKAHLLTHQKERPEKCPIATCYYQIKGFARKYDLNRHILTHYKGTMVCGFCPGSNSSMEKSFNRVDVFRRHLTSVHEVAQMTPNSRKKTPGSIYAGKKLASYAPDATGNCSTCSIIFNNAQDLYEHLDDCVLRVVQQEDFSEAINAWRLAEVENYPAVHDTLRSNGFPTTTAKYYSADEDDKEEELEELDDDDGDDYNTSQGGKSSCRGVAKASSSNGSVQKSQAGGLTHSKGGVALQTKGRRKRKDYPESWGRLVPQMKMKKRVMCVFSGARRILEDDMMLSNDYEVRIPLGDGKAYVTDLDVQTLKQSEGLPRRDRGERAGPVHG